MLNKIDPVKNLHMYLPYCPPSSRGDDPRRLLPCRAVVREPAPVEKSKVGRNKLITCLIRPKEKIAHILTCCNPRPAATTHGVCCAATLSFASLHLVKSKVWREKNYYMFNKIDRWKNYARTYLAPSSLGDEPRGLLHCHAVVREPTPVVVSKVWREKINYVFNKIVLK